LRQDTRLCTYDEFLAKINPIFDEFYGKTQNLSDFHEDQPNHKLEDAFRQAGLYEECWKWVNCGRKVFFFRCLACGAEFYVPYRCDLRICPKCNERYFRLFKARYFPKLKGLMGQKGKDRLMFLTLTTRNTGDIPEKAEIRAHNKAVGKLIKNHFKGGVSVNEVKGTYLHSHCIVYGRYVPHEKLCQEWEALTGNKVVDIREIKWKAHHIAYYLCKYIKKPYQYEDSEAGHSLAIQFLMNFKGVRRVHSFGIFYGMKGKDKPQFVCPYCGGPKVVLDFEKSYQVTVTECKLIGILSYKTLLKVQENHLWDLGRYRCQSIGLKN
jgi:hypothetical protein